VARSLHRSADRARIAERFTRLAADTPARWGRMDVAQMLHHTNEALRMALGDRVCAPRGKWLFRTFPVKYLIFYVLPFPKGASTAKELVVSAPCAFADEARRSRELLERFGTAPVPERGPEHPMFGPLSGREWGVLQHKHLDHHLRQFGV
jgi:hypothetical protein